MPDDDLPTPEYAALYPSMETIVFWYLIVATQRDELCQKLVKHALPERQSCH
jgi:hypothetical protein